MKLKFTYKVKVFYMPGPVLGEGVTCTALATQADLLPPFKVIRDYDYDVIPHNHISYSD
jgi:hypothetical protein